MNYNVPSDYQINLTKNSTIKTMNNYKKEEVSTIFIDCLKKRLIVDSNYWCAELLASNNLLLTWDLLLNYYFQSLSFSYPILIEYFHKESALIGQIKKSYTGNLKN